MNPISTMNGSTVFFVRLWYAGAIRTIGYAIVVMVVTACLAEEKVEGNEAAFGEKAAVNDDNNNDEGGDMCDTEVCSAGEYCDLAATPPVCRKPATGQGEPCTNQGDCAGYEADFCEYYVSFMCLVKDCSVELDNCSAGYKCCGFTDPTTFPPEWDLPESLCLDKELLGGDECNTR